MGKIIPTELVQQKIFLIRGRRVMLDRDLARLYGVTTGNFNKAVNRNIERFPNDFMSKVNQKEFEDLRFQFGISSWGGRRYLPKVFTEQGIAMLSSVLHSKRAIQVNIIIMRAFVQLREMLSTHKRLANKLIELEKRIENHDEQIMAIFDAIRKLMVEEEKPKTKIGFHMDSMSC